VYILSGRQEFLVYRIPLFKLLASPSFAVEVLKAIAFMSALLALGEFNGVV
jgi:hypothetical protein